MKHTLIALAVALLMASTAHAGSPPESPLASFPSLTGNDPGISKTPVDPASKARKSASAQQAKTAPAKQAAKPAPTKAPVQPAKSSVQVAKAPEPQPVRFATAQSPAPAIAAAPSSPQIASLSMPSQVRPYILSASESAYLDEEASLKRKVRLLELQAKAAELQRKIDGEANPIADSVNAKPVNPQASVLDIPPPQPFRLISVWGAASNLHADLLMNGVRVPVAKGYQLPDGWVVANIASDAVQLRRGRQAMVLKIGG